MSVRLLLLISFLTFFFVTFESIADEIKVQVLLDDSGSITPKGQEDIKRSLKVLLDGLQKDDEVKVWKFSSKIFDYTELKNKNLDTSRVINKLKFDGQWTRMFDALGLVLKSIGNSNEKDAIVVFSDGNDENSKNELNTLKRGSHIPISFYQVEGASDIESGKLKEIVSKSGGVYASKEIDPIITFLNKYRSLNSSAGEVYEEPKNNIKKEEKSSTQPFARIPKKIEFEKKVPPVKSIEKVKDQRNTEYYLLIILLLIILITLFFLHFTKKSKPSSKRLKKTRKAPQPAQPPNNKEQFSENTKEKKKQRKTQRSGSSPVSGNKKETAIDDRKRDIEEALNRAKKDFSEEFSSKNIGNENTLESDHVDLKQENVRSREILFEERLQFVEEKRIISKGELFNERIARTSIVQAKIFEKSSYPLKNKEEQRSRVNSLQSLRKQFLVEANLPFDEKEFDSLLSQLHDEWARLSLGKDIHLKLDQLLVKCLKLGYLKKDLFLKGLKKEVVADALDSLLENAESSNDHLELLNLFIGPVTKISENDLKEERIEKLNSCKKNFVFGLKDFDYNLIFADLARKLLQTQPIYIATESNREAFESEGFFHKNNLLCSWGSYLPLDSTCNISFDGKEFSTFHVLEIDTLLKGRRFSYKLLKVA